MFTRKIVLIIDNQNFDMKEYHLEYLHYKGYHLIYVQHFMATKVAVEHMGQNYHR